MQEVQPAQGDIGRLWLLIRSGKSITCPTDKRGESMATDRVNLQIGVQYAKKDLEGIFQMSFGFKINGIVVRHLDRDSERRLIMLFQRSDGPYPDTITKERIKYIGAGLHGDQTLKGLNRVLEMRGPIDGVFFFHQPSGSDKWTYLGWGIARYAGEEWSGGRKVLAFDVELER